MKPYLRTQSIKDLVELPPLAETSGYEVLEGNPVASIRIDQGSLTSKNRLGIWGCSTGAFRCTEKGNELQTIIEGKLILIYEDGTEHPFGPGDSIFTEKGEVVIWKIIEPVKKVFFTYDECGN